MLLRKIIREQIAKVLSEQGDNSAMDIFANIGQQLSTDMENVAKIITTQGQDIENDDNEFKANSQLKSKLTQGNPQRVGLERELPEKQKEIEARKKQLKDLQNTQQGLQSAQDEIDKQKKQLQQLQVQKQNTNSKGSQSPPSNLPSHNSPI